MGGFRFLGIVARSALVAGALGAAGCDVFDPGLLDAGPSDGGADGAVDGGSDACVPRHPPPRPDVEDGEDTEEILLVLKDVLLDQGRGTWRSVGFDLDGLCSYAPAPAQTCALPEGVPPEIDGDDGIDNTVGHNLLELAQLAVRDSGGDLQQDARDTQNQGNGVLMARIRGWNGEADDPGVHAVFAQGRFGTPPLPDGGVPDVEPSGVGGRLPDGGVAPVPRWDGNDWFWARSDNFVDKNPGLPRVEDPNAYVADGTLVMTFDSRVDLVFGGVEQGVIVKVTDTTVTVPIVDRVEGEPALGTAVVGGRWAVDDLIATAEQVGVCPGSVEYGVLERTIAESVDLTADPRAPVDTPCDAVSIGVTLEAYRGRWAGLGEPNPLPNFCELARMDGGVADGGLDGGLDGGGADGGGGAGLDGGPAGG